MRRMKNEKKLKKTKLNIVQINNNLDTLGSLNIEEPLRISYFRLEPQVHPGSFHIIDVQECVPIEQIIKPCFPSWCCGLWSGSCGSG